MPASPPPKLQDDKLTSEVVCEIKESPKHIPSVSQSVVDKETSVSFGMEKKNVKSLGSRNTKRARVMGPTMPPSSEALSNEESDLSRRDHANQVSIWNEYLLLVC